MRSYVKWIALNAISQTLMGLARFVNGAALAINGVAESFDGGARCVAVARNRQADKMDVGFTKETVSEFTDIKKGLN